MADENPTEAEAVVEEPKAGGVKALLPAIGLVVAGLAAGGGGGMFLLGPMLAPRPHAAAQASDGAAKPEHATKKGEKTSTTLSMYQIDNLVLNPAGSGGTRFLLLSVALETKDENANEILKAHDAELRDAILRLFGSKTADEVAEASSRDALRRDVLDTVSKLFPSGTVKRVYFPQFVIQ